MKLHLNGGYIVYEKIGDGTPILFIHGYPLSRKIWDPQIDGLSSIASIITVDLRGHGDSYPFPGSYSMELLADDCKKVLDTLQINSPLIICGLSMGGYVIMAMYRKYPHLFKGMVLTSTQAKSDSPEAKAKREKSMSEVKEKGVGYIADSMLPKLFSSKTYNSTPDLIKSVQEIMAGTSVEGIVGSLQGMKERPDSTNLLSEANCPILIIHGEDDQTIPVNTAEQMRADFPHSHLVKVPDSGHLLNLEQPELYNQALSSFISSL